MVDCFDLKNLAGANWRGSKKLFKRPHLQYVQAWLWRRSCEKPHGQDFTGLVQLGYARFKQHCTIGRDFIEHYSGWVSIPWSDDDFGLTWLPHSRYSRVFWMWMPTCFFSLPLDAALEVRAAARGEGQPFRWGNKLPASLIIAPYINIFMSRSPI